MTDMGKWRQFAGVALLMLTAPGQAIAAGQDARTPEAAAVLPLPASIEQLDSRYRPGTRITIALPPKPGAELRQTGSEAADLLGKAWKRPALVTQGRAPQGAVRLALAGDAKTAPESYHLEVSATGIQITAPTTAGLFYGLQTLRQLAEQGGATGIAAVRIDDAPRFGWRGLHLDVARHIMPVEYIKRQLDLMARYKYNRFHWHLTDDQGWRLEIKRYPRLTSVGAWRDETVEGRKLDPYVGDGKRYGGFYTQAQVREVVAYAKALHIEVIPEIEIPGHTVAVLASYPELGCTPGPFKVRTTWGVADDIICPSDASIAFVKNVMLEVMALFPSAYIHLGGDEAPTIRWEHSALAQSIIKREGLKNEFALQGWFLRQIEEFLAAHGRKIIGWDEILDGNPLPSATVMSWRGTRGGIEAAQRGHDVIMSPTDTAYFDYCQGPRETEPVCIGGNLPLGKVYAYDPVPAVLTPEQATHILGAQGNVWTEYLKTPESVEYMLWPRGLAMAELLWTPQQRRDWAGFTARLAPQLAALEQLGVNYRIPGVEGLESDVLSLEPVATLRLHTLLPNAEIRYTLDGSEPGARSPLYRGPVTLSLSAAGTTVTARSFVDGRAGPIARARYRLAQLQPAATSGQARQPGLRRRYFEAAVTRVGALDGFTPARGDIAAGIGLPDYAHAETFGLIFDGYLRVPADGIYTFALQSDDGAVLWIGGEKVIDRDGPQSAGETRGAIALKAGRHPVTLRYFQGGGAAALRLLVSRDGGTPREVPADWWSQP